MLDGANTSFMLQLLAVVMHVGKKQNCFRIAKAVSLAFGDYYWHDSEGFATCMVAPGTRNWINEFMEVLLEFGQLL